MKTQAFSTFPAPRVLLPTVVVSLTTGLALLFVTAVLAQNTSLPQTNLGPTGTFEYELGSQETPALWNLSGLYSLPFYQSLRFHHDAKGAITSFFETGDTNSPVLTGTIAGSSSRLKIRLRSVIPFQEFVSESYYLESVMRKDQLSVTFDPSTSSLAGTDRVSRTRQDWIFYNPDDPFSAGDKVRIVLRTKTSVEPITLTVPETTDGSWALSLNLVSAGRKISGTASIQFANSEVFQFQVAGNYVPKNQTTKLVLKGAGVDKGATLMLSLSGPQMDIQWMRGRVGGQSVRFP